MKGNSPDEGLDRPPTSIAGMMTRRALLKLVALLPVIGPAVAKALSQGACSVSRVYGPYLPATFPTWSKAVDGLENSFEWALSIERSWLPSGLAFPREGQVWEAVHDCEIPILPLVLIQPLKFHSAQIKAGERVRVVHVDGPKPLYVSFVRMTGGLPILENSGSQLGSFSESALRLKTVKTVADLVHKERQRVFFLEAFRLVAHGA